MRLTIFLGAIVALLLSAPAQAARSSPTTAKPEILRIPFAPPVGTELRYAVTQTQKTPDKTSTIATEQVHLFTPSTDGYVLTIRTARLSVEGRELDPTTSVGQESVPAMLRPFLLPVGVDVGRDGSFIRLRDWPRLREAIAGFPDVMASTAQTPEERETLRKVGSNVVANFLSLTAEQAPAIMLKTWAPLFGYGDLELEAGEVYEVTDEVPSPLLPVNISMTQQMVLSRADDGHFHYEQASEPDREQNAALVARFLRQAGEGLSADERANVEKAVEHTKTIRMENHLDLILNAASGIVERATVERLFSIEGAGDGGESITVARLN